MGELSGNTSPPTIRTLDYGLQYHSGGDQLPSVYNQNLQMTSAITKTTEPSVSPASTPNMPSVQPIHKMATHPLQIQILAPHPQTNVDPNQVPPSQIYTGHGMCVHQRQGVGGPLPTPSPSSASAKRPSNSWILYRKEKHPQVLAQNPDISNNEISKIVAKMWKNEPESVKDKYKLQAQIERNMHRQLYPDYKYAPRKNKVRRHRWTAPKNNSAVSGNQQISTQGVQNTLQSKVHQHLMMSQWQEQASNQIPHTICQQQTPNPSQNCQVHQHDGFDELNYLFNAYQSPVSSEPIMRSIKQQIAHPQQQKSYYYIPQQYIQQSSQPSAPISPHPDKSFLSPPRYGQGDLIPTPTSAQPDPTPQKTQMFQLYSQSQDIKPKDCHNFPMQQHVGRSPNPPNFLRQQ